MTRNKEQKAEKGFVLFGLAGVFFIVGGTMMGIHLFKNGKTAHHVPSDVIDAKVDGNATKIVSQRDVKEIASNMESFLDDAVTLKLGKQGLSVNRRDLGLSINEAELEETVEKLTASGVPVESLGKAIQKTSMPFTIDRQVAEERLLELKESLDVAPRNARLDLEKREVIPAQEGFGLEPYGSISEIEKAARLGQAEIELEGVVMPAEITVEELGIDDISTLISSFETKFSVAEKTRNSNLKRLASMIDGLVLKPGEEFSFNKTTGMRTLEDGFKMAHVISSGEMVDGMAGGSCQISTTLHGAAFFGGVDIVSSKPHSRPSTYVQMGLDATVVAGITDMKLKNPYDFPIAIHFKVARGVSRAEILGKEKPFDKIEFERKIVERLDFRTVTREDMEIGVGHMVVDQSGYPGYKVRRTRRMYKDGDVIKSNRWNINYYPVIEYARIGINPDPNLPAPKKKRAHGPKPAKGTFKMVR